MTGQSATVNAVEAAPAGSLAAWMRVRRFQVVLLLLSLAGVALVLVNTRWGAYLSDDTYYYIYPARDLLAGKGFHPSYIFALLFPLALAVLSLLGLETLDAARWLNAVLFGVNIFLVGRISLRLGVPSIFALLAAALVLLADVIIEAHGWAMSESLSLTFMLLTFVFLLRHVATGGQSVWWAAALSAAACVLSRYAALPLIAAAALALLVYAPSPRIVGRLKSALLFGLAAAAPIVLYWLRNQLTSGQPVRYERFLPVPFTREQLDWFLYHWLSLFLPGRLLRERELLFGTAIGVAAAALVLTLVWVHRRELHALAERRFSAALLLFAAVVVLNFAMLYLARGLTSLDVFNPRYLVPPLIPFLMLLAVSAGRLWQVSGNWLRLALIGAAVLFLAYYGYRTVDFTRTMRRHGLGYSNASWHNSETVEYLLAHPEMTDLVSTGEMGIYFWTGRMPKVLAAFSNPQAVQNYLCQNEGAVLLLMDQMPAEIYGMHSADLIQILELVEDFNDSDMLKCPNGAHLP